MIRRIFITFFGVQMITYVTTVLGNIVDGIVTGRFLGADALSAYGLATPFLTLVTAVATAVSVGTSTLISNKLGKGELNEMRKAFKVCFWTAVVVSAAIGICIFAFANTIATALKAEGGIQDMAVDYLRGYAIGIPAIFIVTISMPVMQIIGKRPVLLASIVILSGVNVLGDFINVLFVHGGMFGMALATTISFYVGTTILLVTIEKSGMLSIAPTGPDGSMIKDMVIYGAPNAISMGCRNILTIMMNNLIIGIAGVQMIAAYASIMSSMNLAISIASGLANTVSMLTGVFSGEKDRNDLITLIKLAIKYSIIINAICMIAFIVCSGGIVSLFLKDEALLEDASLGLKIVITNCILFSINFCIRSYYQAMKMKITIPFAVFNGLVGTLIAANALGRSIGIVGVWLAYPIGELLTLLIFGAYALWKERGSGRSWIERYMMIPEEYYGDVEPVEINVFSMKDVQQASYNTGAYMEEHGADKRIALYASLAVEELAGNVIEHGFNDGKSHHMTVKIKKDCERWILRLRDDCRNFDPVAYVKGITGKEKESHYGIRMIYGLADEVIYLNTLKLNNLIIKFGKKGLTNGPEQD